MLKSSLCYLSTMTSEELFQAGECKFELGGYFIIDGAEKTLLTQERLSDNMFYASKRRVKSSGESGKRTLVEKEEASKLEKNPKMISKAEDIIKDLNLNENPISDIQKSNPDNLENNNIKPTEDKNNTIILPSSKVNEIAAN